MATAGCWSPGFSLSSAYSKAVAVERDPAWLRSAYLKRSTAYVSRGEDGDLEQALTDRLAAGKTVLPLMITVEKANLQRGATTAATVRKGQVVNVTHIKPFQGNIWLFVKSVDGNDAAQGYVKKDAVVKKPASPVHVLSGIPAQVQNS